jgi:hypothetical protein
MSIAGLLLAPLGIQCWLLQVDSVFELDGVQFCSLVVHGQSFM